MISRLKRVWCSEGLMSRLDFGLVVVLVLPIFAAFPLLQPGLPRTADGLLHLLRVVEMDQCWSAGIYFPRWAPDMAFGYGVPLFNFYAPLLYQIAEIVHLVGFGFATALKLALTGCLIVAAWGTYALAKDILGAKPAVLAAAAYVYAPFTLREIYVTGGYAQFLAASLIPATLFSFHRLITQQRSIYVALGSILLSSIILSHNISAMLFLPFLLLFALWTISLERRWRGAAYAVLALALALATSAFFWLPALYEKSLVRLSLLIEGFFDFHQYFVSFAELISPSMPLDSSSMNPAWLDNLGTAQVTLSFLGLVALGTANFSRRGRMRAMFFVIAAALSIFMMLQGSASVWEHVPLLAFTEFPRRFMILTVPAVSLLTGMGVCLGGRIRWRPLTFGLVPLAMVFTVGMAFFYLYQSWPSLQREDLSPTDIVLFELRTQNIGTTSADEVLPIWVNEDLRNSPLVDQYRSGKPISKLDDQSLPGEARAELIAHTVVSDEYDVVTSEPLTVQFHTLYFPGWEASVDGQSVDIRPSYPRGLITVDVPAGDHRVFVRFADTPVRVLANITSATGLVLIIGITISLALKRRGEASASTQGTTRSGLPVVDACFLILSLVALLVIKVGFIDPKTTWFRKSSPPGQVLGVQYPSQINLGNDVMFLGYDASSESVMPGDTISLTLYWEAQSRLREDFSAFVHLDDLRANYISWSLSEEMNPANIPTSAWSPGLYVSDPHRLGISAETPPGVYVLRAGLYLRGSGERLPVLDSEGEVVSDSLDLARIRVRRTTPVDLSRVTAVGPLAFGDRIRLVGYELVRSDISPGNHVKLLLYWEALAEVSESYTVFIHLLDRSGQMWAQGDSLPMNGMYPTWAWLRGEIVEDEHLIPLESTVPPGTYHLAVGLYEMKTLGRLEITSPEGARLGDQAVLQTPIEVLNP